MYEHHYLKDYNAHVRALIEQHGHKRAMQIAIGDNFATQGALHVAALTHFGLKDGDRLIDIGCGSGRTAAAISKAFDLSYYGFDVVPELVDYARENSPEGYEFGLAQDVAIAQPDSSADMACAFSVFTHLLHEESYLYMAECARVLRPGGRLVFSFLEFAEPCHWTVFEYTVASAAKNTRPHLNIFMDRTGISAMAAHLGFAAPVYFGGIEILPGAREPMGQALCMLEKAAA